jgi:hypothetical protein
MTTPFRQVDGPRNADTLALAPPISEVACAHPPTPEPVDTNPIAGDRESSMAKGEGNCRGIDKGKEKRTEAETEKDNEKVDMINGRPRDVYDRFTPAQKVRMTAIVSFSALLSRKSCSLASTSWLSLCKSTAEWR